MKKFLSILALALCFVACQNDAVESVSNSDLVDVVLTVDAPEMGVTRGLDGDQQVGRSSALGAIDFFDDDDWAKYDVRYILEVYAENEDGTGEPIYRERLVNCLDKYAPTTFALRLVPERTYKFVVFADFVADGNHTKVEPAAKLAIDDWYYNTSDLRNITIKSDADGFDAMNEARDAYFITKNVKVSTTGLNEPLTLTRPFAKLRVIATDLDYITGYAKPGYVEVKYHTEKVYKSFNAVNGKLNAEELTEAERTFKFNVQKDAPYTDGYDKESTNQTLFADYLLAVEGEQTTVNFTMDVYESEGGQPIHSHDFNTQIPIQRNHLTTIIGDLLTTQANIKITIDDNFEEKEFVYGWGDDNATTINVWNAGELNADGDYTFVVNGENDFKVTVNGAAVKNQKLTAGDYVLAEDAKEGAELTFTVEELQANETTRALTAVEVIGGTMKVESIENNYKITLDLVLEFSENKDVRHAIYVYEGPISFGKVLDTPKVEAAVEGNVITLTWNAVADATSYTIIGGTEMPVVTEETSYVFTGEYETEYTFTVVAVNDNLASQPFNVTVKTDAAPVVEEGYKLYFANVANWAKVYAHIWANEGEDLGLESVEWPGRELTETEVLDGDTYYVFQLPSTATGKTLNVVFNDGNGTQTKDLAGVVEGNLFFDNYVEPVAPSEVVLYLQPNANWNVDGARFAAYFFGNGETWVDMTLVEGETNIYAVTVPNGFESVIFCRMNPGAAANNWNNKWNQTADLTIPTDGTNLYTVTENTWDNGGGVWSVYAPTVVEPEKPTVLATPVVTAVAKENTVTLTWEAVENAAAYSITVGTEMPVVTEELTYTFTGEYETEYTFNVVAIPADEEKFAASEAGVATATTEAEPQSETPVAGSQVSVAKFLEMADTETEYVLTGKVARVVNTQYGNFDLTDETGTIYIYGLVSPTGAAQYWAESGVREGDTITVKGKYSVYNNSPQVKNAVYVSHVPAPFVFAEATAIEADVVEVSISVESNVAWTVSCDAAWVKSYSKSGTNNSDIDIEVEANTTTENRVATFTISGEGVADYTVTLTQYGVGTSDTKGTYTSEAFFKGGTDGGKSYQEKVNVGGTQYDCLKLGTSSVIGKYTTKAVGESGDLTLSFYAVGWNGKNSMLNVYVDGVKVGETLTLTGNSGAANNAPYTITPSDTTDYYSISVPGITEDSKITFETVSGATRAIIFGVQLY